MTTPTEAAAAIAFATSKPEPGPYVVIEVLRQSTPHTPATASRSA